MADVHISIVTPVYGCSKSLNNLYSRLNKVLSEITENFEIIMVNDSSPDDAWETITKLATKDSRVKGINLSRNFGQHAALSAGLDYSSGEYIIIMDCDLQDQPEEIIKLYSKIKEGYDAVVAKRVERRDSYFKKLSSKIFYSIFNYLSNQKHDSSIANFGIFKRKLVNYYNEQKEQQKFFPFFINSIGFKRTDIEVNHSKREEGKSSYNLFKLIDLSISIVTSFSNKPLKLFIKFGMVLSLLSFCIMIWILINHFINDTQVSGWASTILTIIFFNGVLLMNLGVIGLYIGNIYSETKNRKIYYIQDTLNLKEEDN